MEIKIELSPTRQQLEQTKQWLEKERSCTGQSFICNWRIIQERFKNGSFACALLDGDAVGFAIWHKITEPSFTLEIMAVKPELRRKYGIGKTLANTVFSYFQKTSGVMVKLQCQPQESETFWRKLGFQEPNYHSRAHRAFDQGPDLHKILIKTAPLLVGNTGENEVIDLWAKKTWEATSEDPNWTWQVIRRPHSRKLLLPIVSACSCDWRLRWRTGAIIHKDDKVKYLSKGCYESELLYIRELPDPKAV